MIDIVYRPFTKKDLIHRFKDKQDRYIDHKWLIKQEKAGRLICPRTPHNNWRVFTQDEMDEIIVAFSPGGAGYWHFQE